MRHAVIQPAWLVGLAVALMVRPMPAAAPTEVLTQFEVVIAGGSTAAIAAAFTAAEEGAKTALLEPTDWIGGQLTSSGVPAVDEAWHKLTDPDTGEVLLDVARVARDPANMTPFFREALAKIGNPGRGWVSRYCFEPRVLLEGCLEPRERSLSGKLTVFRNTVVKRASVDPESGQITSLTAIERTPRPSTPDGGYDRLPSQDLADWYSEKDSPRFAKRVLRFTAASAQKPAVFVDATEWGELLALSGAPYLQGTEAEEGETASNDRCGQAITYGFVQEMHAAPVAKHPTMPKIDNLGLGAYRDKPDAWERIWTYRRLRGAQDKPSPGDLTLQNWGYEGSAGEGGNDYPFGYVFLSKADTARQTADWRGGVDTNVLAAAEQRALAWHEWFRNAAPEGIDPDQITLAPQVFGAAHGLAKLPYIRDTRRSVGVDGFVLRVSDLIGPASQQTGTRFPDRVALGAYAADIHPLVGCSYPASLEVNHPTLPFYIPLRSLTNDGRGNLLVAGKTMAQTFLANSATRLHPIEWSSGCAAGVAAAMMAEHGWSSREAVAKAERVQLRVRRHTPIEWKRPRAAANK
ncbi:FAD dependent oxidoreductase [Pirellulimonas nuda]|uniref:FAD dependent oxidoreductase n=1 Tax=Pirellulimonas nuda TaxID=2528009 RepID=A0A518DBG4_9BACT|nr:FAD-dependent oxidoreductase [Pirellulimonas nuda]QDU88803.1 FAD dependent oxidoreductase [Pirellulimonas nuda]